MILSKSELKRLRTLQLSKERPPTTLRALWQLKSILLGIVILILIAFLIAYRIFPSQSLAYFILGFGAGGLWFICTLAMRLPHLWRLTREILNWNRIEELMKEHENDLEGVADPKEGRLKSAGLFLVKTIVLVCVFWSLWIVVFRPLSGSLSGSSAATQSRDDQALRKKSWEQAREADRLQAKFREQAAIADEQLKRMNALLTAREQQTKRFDEVLKKWEQQPGTKK